jgi:hypothetical protein
MCFVVTHPLTLQREHEYGLIELKLVVSLIHRANIRLLTVLPYRYIYLYAFDTYYKINAMMNWEPGSSVSV